MVVNETKAHQQRLEDRLSVERERDRFAQTQLSDKVLAQVEKLQLHRHSVAHQRTYVQGEPEIQDSTPINTWAHEQAQSIVQARKFPAVAIPSPSRSDSLSHISDDWSGMGIRANLGNISDCSRSCKYSCHIRRRLQTPRLLEGLLGTFFLGYSGSPILSQNCDQSSCRGGKCSSASFTYQFPRWFVQSRMIELQAKITAMYGPELLLRFNRVVDGKALVFHYASTGNVEKMKQLFVQRRASPATLGSIADGTPLHVSKIDCVPGFQAELLLRYGWNSMPSRAIRSASVSYSCRLGATLIWKPRHLCKSARLRNAVPPVVDMRRTAAYYAAGVILGRTGFDISAIDGLRELFHDPAFLEYARFSDLHKVVLQLQGGSVHEELQVHRKSWCYWCVWEDSAFLGSAEKWNWDCEVATRIRRRSEQSDQCEWDDIALRGSSKHTRMPSTFDPKWRQNYAKCERVYCSSLCL